MTIDDNGPGIADDIIGHLFEPFFTTKESGEGLGLGLAISAAIASEYGGSLRASNRPGAPGAAGTASISTAAGARFTLTLRRADNNARQSLINAS
jgi:two-component system C4-dicarboxylate transport sensor histidine kinase DctB